MWYYKAKRYAQSLNIPGPIQGLPGYVLPSAPSQPLKKQHFDPYTGAPVDDSSDEQELPPQEIPPSLVQFPLPPIHERCHCRIESLPSGRKVWRANESACEQCYATRDAFNQAQDEQFPS